LALRATGLLDTPPEETFDRLTRLAGRILDVPVSLISLVDIDRQFFKSQIGLPAPYDTNRQTPLTHSFCQHVVVTEDVLLVRDAKNDPRVCDNLAVRDLNVIAYLGVPLRMTDGSVLGSLCAIDGAGRDWSPDDISALWDLAQIVMDEIALRLEMGKRRKAECEEKLERELHDRIIGSLAAVKSIVNMSAEMATTLIDFREAVVAQFAELPRAERDEGKVVELEASDTSLFSESIASPGLSQRSEGKLKSPPTDDD
jgi:GAF domain-containing protein